MAKTNVDIITAWILGTCTVLLLLTYIIPKVYDWSNRVFPDTPPRREPIELPKPKLKSKPTSISKPVPLAPKPSIDHHSLPDFSDFDLSVPEPTLEPIQELEPIVEEVSPPPFQKSEPIKNRDMFGPASDGERMIFVVRR